MDDTPGAGQPRCIPDPDAEVLAFLAGRSAPCPRCAIDLRDIRTARCPECGEPLVLQIGSTRVRFAWLVLAMAPGCFSGVAALFVLVPVALTILGWFPADEGVSWPIMAADAFGFLSAASVGFMYQRRHRIMAWGSRRQAAFAAAVWGAHILAFVLVFFALWYWQF